MYTYMHKYKYKNNIIQNSFIYDFMYICNLYTLIYFYTGDFSILNSYSLLYYTKLHYLITICLIFRLNYLVLLYLAHHYNHTQNYSIRVLPLLKILSMFKCCNISLYYNNDNNNNKILNIYKKYNITINKLKLDIYNDYYIPNNVESLNQYECKSINYLPNSIVNLNLDKNNLVNNLPCSISDLSINNCKINNLPYSIKNISLFNYELQLYTLPNNIEKLSLYNYKLDLSNIPMSVKHLLISNYNRPVDFLHENITYLEIHDSNINNNINDLPLSLQVLKIYNNNCENSYYKLDKKITNLPSSIKTIYLQKDNVKYFEKYSNIIKIIK